MAIAAEYPLEVGVDAPLEVARWRPIVQWLLAIPHVIVLSFLQIVAGIFWYISFFAILFTGRLPDWVLGFQAMEFRYNWRVNSYISFLREPYPPFAYEMTEADPGDDPATLRLEDPGALSRWKIFLKWLFAIPHLIVLLFLAIAASVVLLIAWFAVIITGRWPEGLRTFYVGYYRWLYRVRAYVYLLTDVYPPFRLT